MPNAKPFHNRARTKIVATVGPASQSEDKLSALVEAGVDVFRVNTAHGSRQEHETVIQAIRDVSDKLGRPVGILVDLAGPKIRLGTLVEDPTDCRLGDHFTFVRGETAPSAKHLVSNYKNLIDELEVDDIVMLADGTVSMRVVQSVRDR